MRELYPPSRPRSAGAHERTLMQHILVYSDSASWGIIPMTRRRLPFEARWPGVMELALTRQTLRRIRVIEDCLNGRRTVWEDPFKPGRNGLAGRSSRPCRCPIRKPFHEYAPQP